MKRAGQIRFSWKRGRARCVTNGSFQIPPTQNLWQNNPKCRLAHNLVFVYTFQSENANIYRYIATWIKLLDSSKRSSNWVYNFEIKFYSLEDSETSLDLNLRHCNPDVSSFRQKPFWNTDEKQTKWRIVFKSYKNTK